MFAQDWSDEFTIQRLLQRYTESYGGLRDANRLASLSIEGVLIQGNQEYFLEVRKKRPASLHYRLVKGSTSLTSVYNGRRGWLRTARGGEVSVQELSGAELEILKNEARFESPLYRHQEKPENTISLIGREQVGSTQTFVLRVEESDASISHYYLDPQNSQVLRIDRLNEAGEVVLQTLYRDYRDVAGYPFAHEVENRVEGETVSLTRLNSILVNPGLLSIYFEEPSR